MPIRRAEIEAAWKALATSSEKSGIRAIPIDGAGLCMAGLDMKTGMESIFFSFQKRHYSKLAKLPQGKGFRVSTCEFPNSDDDIIWLSLLRHPAGNLEMFCLMSVDVVSFMEKLISGGMKDNLDLLLSRVRAWQTFMKNRNESILGTEEETGLFGELLTLESLMDEGVAANVAIDSWRGPFGAAHDFSLGSGAIEIKTSLDAGQLIIHVSSLDQLDDSLESPLYLWIVRLTSDIDGTTLPELVRRVSGRIGDDQLSRHNFEICLISAGLDMNVADLYSRRFGYSERLFYIVDNSFPRLTPKNVAEKILRVTYEINLDGQQFSEISVSDIIQSLGVLTK